jgi:16S rRNA pseudouridine516 synthase
MKLVKYLANLGYGSRREVEWLVSQRRVRHADGRILDRRGSASHDELRVDGEALDPPPGSVIALHKPVGYVSSSKDVPPLVYELLPERFRFRSPAMAPIGRLDRETSGLLLLTDDGQLNHRISSPRTHLAKMYDVVLAEPLKGDEASRFADGSLQLASDDRALAAAVLEVLEPRRARVTVTEGRYHQVRRMFAAVGNHVETLHRVAIGGLWLGTASPAHTAYGSHLDLASGTWTVLDAGQITMLFASPTTAP